MQPFAERWRWRKFARSNFAKTPRPFVTREMHRSVIKHTTRMELFGNCVSVNRVINATGSRCIGELPFKRFDRPKAPFGGHQRQMIFDTRLHFFFFLTNNDGEVAPARPAKKINSGIDSKKLKKAPPSAYRRRRYQ